MTMNGTNVSVRTACVIVAGGTGMRMGHPEPKQFCLLAGRPVLAYSVEFFGNHPLIEHIVVVVPHERISQAAEILASLDFDCPLTIVGGGTMRQESVYAGIAATDCDYVAVHDGARPFPPSNLDEALSAARQSGSAVFAMPATDSVKRVTDGFIEESVPREHLWAVQTPQIFLRDRLMQALETSHQDGILLTDDASAYEHMGWKVQVVTGSRTNIKITYAEDLIIAESILRGQSQ